MKRSLILLGILAFAISSTVPALAQIPNAGFESWSTAGPDGWGTTFSIGNVSRSTSAHTGSSSIRGEVISFFGTALAPTAQSGVDAQGFPWTQRPGSLTGYYQFSPVSGSGDRLTIIVLLMKGGIGGTSVATGVVSITNAASSWTSFSAPLVYASPATPDTAIISIVLLGNGQGAAASPKVGSFYLVDDLAFGGTASAVSNDGTLLRSFALEQNYPNPFNPSTNIRFSVAQAGHVSLKVYNVLGVGVSSLVNEQKEAGTFSANWNAAGLPSGMYLYRLSVTSDKGQVFEQSKKLVLLK
jgi:hypothetical protein